MAQVATNRSHDERHPWVARARGNGMLICWTRALAIRAALAAAALPASGFAAFSGDIAAGEVVFAKCAPCHSITHPTNRMGPHLMGVVGRRVGSVPGFSYSEAMTRAGESGTMWTPDLLARFASSPRKTIPGNSMRFYGLWSDSDIANLVAYLESVPAH